MYDVSSIAEPLSTRVDSLVPISVQQLESEVLPAQLESEVLVVSSLPSQPVIGIVMSVSAFFDWL